MRSLSVLLWLCCWGPTKLATWQRAYFMSQASLSVGSRASVPVHCLRGCWVLTLTFVGSLPGTTHHFFCPDELYGASNTQNCDTQTEAKQGLKCSQMGDCPPGQAVCSRTVSCIYILYMLYICIYILLADGGCLCLRGRSKWQKQLQK